MTVLLILALFVAFVAIDRGLALASHWGGARRERAKRIAILKQSVRLDFAAAADSLQRVELPNARGRILALDDDTIILDAFRRILVLEGYSVDTVENGPEALFLIERNDYDCVFTDLNMPGMDGVEVVKAVKHLRPDIDVALFTGYASLATAVAAMQAGAADYMEKPFTPEELIHFLDELLAKRRARHQPPVRLVAPGEETALATSDGYCIPGGSFLSEGHAWVRIEPGGQVRIGIDDFAQKAAGPVGHVTMPLEGMAVQAGDPLFSLQYGDRELHFLAPVSGQVLEDNPGLRQDAGSLTHSPYLDGWVCRIAPSDLAAELSALRIGGPAVAWYDEEIKRLDQLRASRDQLDWAELESEFLVPVR